MKILLDTHTFLWLFLNNPRMSQRMLRQFLDADEVYYSIVSLWEIGIKRSGKGFSDLSVPEDWDTYFTQQAAANGISEISVQQKHCKRIESLPFHHRDPFDRMLIAQAMEHDLAVMTHDKAFKHYDIQVLS